VNRRPGVAMVAATVVAGLSACESYTSLGAPAVRFRMESATCGGPITFEFSIDQHVIATEALRDRQTSAAFPTTPGEHSTRAAVVNGSFVHDSTIDLRPGENATVILSPYCS